MRILIHDYAGHPFQAQLSRALAPRGHVVSHAYADNLETPRGALEKSETDPEGLAFVPVEMSADYRKHKFNFRKRRGFEHDYGVRLVEKVKTLSPEVVISGNTPSEPQDLLARACRKQGIRFVSWIQDFYSVAVERLVRRRYPLLAPFVVPLYRRWDRNSFRLSDHIVSITEDFLPILDKMGCGSVPRTVIPNWASLDEIAPLEPSESGWAASQGLAGKFVFLYTGTLAMKHNPNLIAALAKAFLPDDQVRVVVTSEGPGRRWLEEAKARDGLSNLLLFDFQPFSIYSEVLGSASVLMGVLEPDAGIFSVPSKVLSYLCARKALLLAMPLENLAARIVRENGAGTVVAPDDEVGFVRAALDLRDRGEGLKEMGANGRGYAEAHFEIESITDQFERILTGA